MRKILCVYLLLFVPAMDAAVTGIAASGVARRFVRGASLPATCNVGDAFFKTVSVVASYECIAANTWSPIGVAGSAATFVTGAASSTDNAIARFDGTGGKTIQNSVVTIDDTGVTTGITTLQTSGNVGLGGAPSVTAGLFLTTVDAANQNTLIQATNTNAAGTSAAAACKAQADTASLNLTAHGTGQTTSRWGHAIGGYSELLSNNATGLDIGTLSTNPVVIGTNSTANLTIASGGAVTLSSTLGVTGAITPSQTSGIVGTTTNNNVGAGAFGEYQEVKCLTATSGASIAFTNASPTVGTWASPPWTGNGGTIAFGNFACPFTITATAPTGLSTATNYWAVPIDATTFHVSTSAANAAANVFANTTGSTSTSNLTSTLAFSTTAGLSTAVLNLTAGDWDCSGSTIYTDGSTTSVTNLQNGINSASTTMGALGTYNDFETAANIMTATNNPVYSTPNVRLSLSATTAEYLVSLNTFTASTLAGSGFIRCRRMR